MAVEKLKPVVIGKAKKPRAFDNRAISSLPVYYEAQANAWMLSQIFWHWFVEDFIVEMEQRHGPEFEEFCLIMDNCISHSKMIEDLDPRVMVLFLAPNTTALIQPMDQGVIANSNKAGGLHNSTILCRGCKVMLLTNLWNEPGLTNGANGIVQYIVYEQGTQPTDLPLFLLVKFDQYTGPSFHPKEEKLVPIAPVMRKWIESKVEHNRIMLPLIPVYAITIHKSQGQTLNKVILNIGEKEYASVLAYTAIRATKLENVAFDPFPSLDRIRQIFKSARFKKRLHEEERLRNMS
ncbi:unnamed protein product [Meganyctiphanes norvegica]|uniref:DDE-1 domain-containing protein n=1 Tax=Meganyctiphanes norvegica TaxID=48144 RepID=A0AAV2QPU0_MEGNR